MSRHNRRNHRSALQPQPQLSHLTAVGLDDKIRVPRPSHDVFKPVFEKVLDVAKSKLYTTGAIGMTALFVYGKAPEGSLNASATPVSLRYTDEFHKEAVRRKIREKVVAEGASAVVLLLPDSSDREGIFLISGAMPGMTADASITYTFDKATKTFSFSEMAWRDESVSNFFLEGLFSARDGE
jgi:hypothetical protein